MSSKSNDDKVVDIESAKNFSDDDETILAIKNTIVFMKWGIFLILSGICIVVRHIANKISKIFVRRFLRYDKEMDFVNEIGLVRKFKDVAAKD